MSSHDVTIALYGLFALTGVGLELRSRSPHSVIPSLSDVFSRVMSSCWTWSQIECTVSSSRPRRPNRAGGKLIDCT